jgi:hypothetical protein
MDDKVSLIREAWKQRVPGEYHEMLVITKRLRWLLTLKVIVCILLGLERTNPMYDSDYVEVAYLDSGTSYIPGEPTVYWFEAIVVGYAWNRWWYGIVVDGN